MDDFRRILLWVAHLLPHLSLIQAKVAVIDFFILQLSSFVAFLAVSVAFFISHRRGKPMFLPSVFLVEFFTSLIICFLMFISAKYSPFNQFFFFVYYLLFALICKRSAIASVSYVSLSLVFLYMFLLRDQLGYHEHLLIQAWALKPLEWLQVMFCFWWTIYGRVEGFGGDSRNNHNAHRLYYVASAKNRK